MKHLLGLNPLSAADITALLDRAETYVGVGVGDVPKRDDLKGKLIVTLFFEPSTRTKISFQLAARRLGGDVQDFSPGGSSTSKGETFIDTVRNIEAMGIDAVIVRHTSSGAPEMLTRHLQKHVSVINAGDGSHEHPTQGLLDILTIRQRKGTIAGLTVALVGDILHSRVARSNIHGLTKLGAKVIVCGPPTLVPPEVRQFGVEVADDLDDILPRCDVVNLLRVQFERQRSAFFPSVGEYAHLFGMNGGRMKRAKSDVLILAPGPINRGVEITPDVADGPNSAILAQVENGLAVRMAVLATTAGGGRG
ncbi:aspartate carbamoyltransferase catalytic subunit [Limnoglobus roseus]|uniref:Aspartate carbamoyltransferase n=1 Tax=Limnoglobus roseus TaxID=2598579 RepID=A0A5C1A6R1_9BACT|nr:aspartate carbamoyltransferase catalytic subunit [Limnoglobus roseus]QEL14939.1 aspartate/ornithine carbamoyltransferase [Limnoglobus roseus]